MKEAFKKLFIFSLPFILITLVVFLVDPYNVFDTFHIFKDETKMKCILRSHASGPRGLIFWKTFKFRRNPTSNILLGTSRSAEITEQGLERYLGDKVNNMAFGGANYRVISDLFWMASTTTKLKNVIIQTDFNTYEAYSNYDLYGPVRKVINNPIYYFLNADIVFDALAVLYYSVTKDEQFVRTPYNDGSDLFAGTRRALQKGLGRKYFYPEQFYKDLTKISEFCREENINLIFFIAPDYYEVNDYIKMHNMEDEYDRFRSDIHGLGTTIDLNNGIPLSFNKENYLDLFHLKPEITDTLLYMIFNSDSLTNRKR
jgi:hypothetical protein